jgi:RNase adaptor protein for sRNA GlmZ degradation
LFNSFNHLKELGINTEIFFLEANDEVLVHRFGGTRRKHPLTIFDSVLENINYRRLDLVLYKMKDKKITTDKEIVNNKEDFLPINPNKMDINSKLLSDSKLLLDSKKQIILY